MNIARRRSWLPVALLMLFGLSGVAAAAPPQGVSDTEIVIGTTSDLSGVTAVQGVNNSNAVRMVFENANR